MTEQRLSALRYYGGKSVNSPRGVGAWVNSLLPDNPDQLYCEPFAGMLGVLLQRPMMRCEIVNDQNHDVVNWWRCVRDEYEAFARLLEATPYSRAELEAAGIWLREHPGLPAVNEPPDLRRALAWHTKVAQSMTAADGRKPRPGTWFAYYRCRAPFWNHERLAPLAKRLRHVQLENRDACDILERMSPFDDAVLYCDPPYRTTDTRHYQESTVDWHRLTDLLQAQTGRVAVSGYTNEWDHLGWQRFDYETFSTLSPVNSKRLEHLWTNYEPVSAAAPVQPALIM